MVDISKHPLIRQAYELCLAIEKLPASVDQTNAVSLASALMKDVAFAMGDLTTTELHALQAKDLEILVRRLCHQIKEENNVKRLALDYLKRTGREGSVLRDGEFANQATER